MTRRAWLKNSVFAGLAGLATMAVLRRPAQAVGHFAVSHSDAEWHKLLTVDQYDVLRAQGTEAPFSSPLDHLFAGGTYHCAGCDLKLFASATKFDSGTGWPSFWQPLPHAVDTNSDSSLMMQRTEVHCSQCGGHLGHVFDDGPKPTGLRYCMNGVALKFVST